jgi:hypothetical protein
MDRDQIHDAAQTVETAFAFIDQNHDGYLSKAEMTDYIAKHPAEVNTDTALKFMLDNFQLIAGLDSGNMEPGIKIPVDTSAVRLEDLHLLEDMTTAGQSGKRQLIKDDENRGLGFGLLTGGAAAFASAAGIPLLASEAFLENVSSLITVPLVVLSIAPIGAGLGYLYEHVKSTNYYDTKERLVEHLYK